MFKPLFIVALSLLASACVAPVDSSDDDTSADVEEVGTSQAAIASLPSTLCVQAHSHSNSGTNNPLYVKYVNVALGAVGCNLPNGVATGQEACCTATSATVSDSDALSVGTTGFIVGFSGSSNTDGLRITNLSASGNGLDGNIGTYTGLAVDDAMTEGCTAGLFCNSFWIDGDDHWKCKKAIVSAKMMYGYGNNWIYCDK